MYYHYSSLLSQGLHAPYLATRKSLGTRLSAHIIIIRSKVSSLLKDSILMSVLCCDGMYCVRCVR